MAASSSSFDSTLAPPSDPMSQPCTWSQLSSSRSISATPHSLIFGPLLRGRLHLGSSSEDPSNDEGKFSDKASSGLATLDGGSADMAVLKPLNLSAGAAPTSIEDYSHPTSAVGDSLPSSAALENFLAPNDKVISALSNVTVLISGRPSSSLSLSPVDTPFHSTAPSVLSAIPAIHVSMPTIPGAGPTAVSQVPLPAADSNSVMLSWVTLVDIHCWFGLLVAQGLPQAIAVPHPPPALCGSPSLMAGLPPILPAPFLLSMPTTHPGTLPVGPSVGV
ncbi:hypothetical protein C0993_003718 [Termitomyces sp. T159_Od127]|nr:hypothetical protein C0993_003718 [Termitomyces sp. T159_Od127]